MTPPFTAEELQETRKPLLQATQLPPRSYVRFDPVAIEYERESREMRGEILPEAVS